MALELSDNVITQYQILKNALFFKDATHTYRHFEESKKTYIV